MSILPLRFERTQLYIDDTDALSKELLAISRQLNGMVRYGRGRYITDDGRFTIVRNQGGWAAQIEIMLSITEPELYASFSDSGIGQAVFPRRCDVVAILESFLETADVSS